MMVEMRMATWLNRTKIVLGSSFSQAALIVAFGFWVFSPAFHGGWVWDDTMLVADNAIVRDPAGLWKIWFEPGKLIDYFFPIKVSVEWVEWHLWHDDTLGYHLLNVALHICSALLVWRLFSKFELRLAWLGGLIFAIHPAVVESVAWISELKNTLSLPPFLLAMCAFIDYSKRRNRRDYFLALGWFLAAMLCKTTMLMFPVVILLYLWWKQGRIGMSDLKISMPFFAISLGLGFVTFCFLHRDLNQPHIPMGGFFSRLDQAGLSISFYFFKCFWPVGMSAIYPRWTIDPSLPVQFLPWPVLGGVIYWLWTKRAGWGRHALLGLGFFLINIVPIAGFIGGSYMDFTWVMDHFLYIPMIGLIGLVAAGLGRVDEQLPPRFQPLGVGIMAAITAFLAWQSHGYAKSFQNEEMLWSHTLEHDPQSYYVRNNLGVALMKAGRLPDAIEQFQKALQIAPDRAEIHDNWGNALTQARQFQKAIAQYQEASRINPHDAETHNNWGNTLYLTGQFQDAIAQYQEALRIDPTYIEARNGLGLMLIQMNRLPEGIDEYWQALRIRPDNTEILSNLGIALGQMGQLSEAIEQFQKTVELDPENAAAHYNLGVALDRAGRLHEAMEQYQEALRIKPGYAAARMGVAGLKIRGQ